MIQHQPTKKSIEEDLLEYINQQPRRFTEIKKYITHDIKDAKGIEPVSYRQFIKFKVLLEEEGRIANDNGVYHTNITEFRVETRSSEPEDLEIINSPFVGEVKLYTLKRTSSHNLTRMESYIAIKKKSNHKVKLLRLEKSEEIYPHKDPKSFKYAAILFKVGKIKEIYISNALTTNYSGTGNRYHEDMEKFIKSNKLVVSKINVESLNLGDIKDTIVNHLASKGYM